MCVPHFWAAHPEPLHGTPCPSRTSETPQNLNHTIVSYRIASQTLPAHTPLPRLHARLLSPNPLILSPLPHTLLHTAAPCSVSTCTSCSLSARSIPTFSSPSRPVFFPVSLSSCRPQGPRSSEPSSSPSCATSCPVHRSPFSSVQLLRTQLLHPAPIAAAAFGAAISRLCVCTAHPSIHRLNEHTSYAFVPVLNASPLTHPSAISCDDPRCYHTTACLSQLAETPDVRDLPFIDWYPP